MFSFRDLEVLMQMKEYWIVLQTKDTNYFGKIIKINQSNLILESWYPKTIKKQVKFIHEEKQFLIIDIIRVHLVSGPKIRKFGKIYASSRN
jgi:hypothetical protein